MLKISNNFIFNVIIFNANSVCMYVWTTLSLPLNEITEHLVMSTLHTNSFKEPWFLVKLKK